jgi:hypothetical protein
VLGFGAPFRAQLGSPVAFAAAAMKRERGETGTRRLEGWGLAVAVALELGSGFGFVPGTSHTPMQTAAKPSRIVDRTFGCTPIRGAGGLRIFHVDAVPLGETDSFTRNPNQNESPGFIGMRTGPWVFGSELVAVRARSWLRFPPTPGPPGVYTRAGRCVPVRASLPLSPRGLPGPPVEWAEKASCTSRASVLVRVRAVLRSPASWRRANRSYDGARGNVAEAAIAVRSLTRRQAIAFAELGRAGETRLWMSPDCT